MKLRINAVVALIAFAAIPVYAKVSFGSLDLNGEDQLLFSARHEIPGTPVYDSLFLSKLGKNKTESSPKILTCFPERMELLNGGRTVQIRNRYGTAWYDVNSMTLRWISSANGIPVEYTHTGVVSESPDGKWLCYVRQTKNALGQLVLQNVQTQEEQVIVESTPFSYETVPVKWASDSVVFLYEKNNEVYFLTPDAAFKNVQLPEGYRKIGSGTINSVEWTSRQELIYIDNDIIYRIRENELYTRGLYSALVGSGTIIGRLPGKFIPQKDRFWTSTDGMHLVLVNGDNLVNFYSIVTGGYDFVKINSIFPLNKIKGSPIDFEVFWTSDKKPMMWISLLNYSTGRKSSAVYRIGENMELMLDVISSAKPRVSPDKKLVAFTGGNSIYVYDIDSWKQVNRLSGEQVISFVWASPSVLYVGGNKSVRLWITDSKNASETVLFLSSASEAFWIGGRILSLYTDSDFYSYDMVKNSWSKANAASSASKTHSEKNGRYRVFTGNAQNKRYDNAIFVRSLAKNVVTYPVFPETDLVTPQPKKVSLVFDAMDNAEGLARVLYVIDEFDVPATFFLNGEFIRRYPTETKQIVASGAECASSFYSTADLTAKHFVIDESFIKRGLARNEDEFFSATGKELSLLWHAPWYHDSALMKRAGNDAGYRYVSAYTKYNDAMSLEEGVKVSGKSGYLDAGVLIDLLVGNLSDGMVIPVSVGKSTGTRKDYLFEKLDLLVAAILDSGYEIVGVRQIVEE